MINLLFPRLPQRTTVKTWVVLFLALLMFPIGCAPGYYEKPGSHDVTPSYYETKKWYQNPETEEEREMRIWREETRRQLSATFDIQEATRYSYPLLSRPRVDWAYLCSVI
jgi:hypothetical protein